MLRVCCFSKEKKEEKNAMIIFLNNYKRISKGHSKNRQSRESGNTDLTRQIKTNKNTICVGHYFAQTNTKR
jgi:hypothetical protein